MKENTKISKRKVLKLIKTEAQEIVVTIVLSNDEFITIDLKGKEQEKELIRSIGNIEEKEIYAFWDENEKVIYIGKII